ncbi:Smr domain-containing [Pyrenophora seminiperda CCB06]|uniref:Smr domain-containing n=1 Tax=Pyrenophora seminiperda CCB06 TaxID=1302712 RepID=A0A3M7M2Z6_9PLEO|nr:Smr domain-containing [Pyrenophora seminiperda CCB06]
MTDGEQLSFAPSSVTDPSHVLLSQSTPTSVLTNSRVLVELAVFIVYRNNTTIISCTCKILKGYFCSTSFSTTIFVRVCTRSTGIYEDVNTTRTKMDEDLRMLEEYCPPIDPTLLYTIYSDYAGEPNAVSLTRQLLDPLKITADVEALNFDPSGSSGGAVQDAGKHTADAESNGDSWATQTVATDRSHLSSDSTQSGSGRSAIGKGSSENGYYKDTEQFDVPTKELLLAETFPGLRLAQVTYTLKKCDYDYDKATDELLNQVFFDDSRKSPTGDGPIVKGIDAFSEDHVVPQRGKKGKNKKKQRLSLNGPDTSYFVEANATTNRWQNTNRHVEFVTTRTNLSVKTVSSIYHANGASLSATVLALVRKNIEAHRKDEQPDAALLAKSLTQQPASEMSGKGGIQLDLRYAPVDLSEASEETKVPVLTPSARPRDIESTTAARNEAFEKASGAYRRGKGTPYMRQAAAYYAQEGRDLNANLKVMNAAQADALVSSQSGLTHLDLHGVSVADATRIAKQRTQAWWDGLGERRLPEWSGPGRRGGGEAYRIITGLGRHSEGGKGKLGPAVLKTLVNEGWKVEAEPGELLGKEEMKINV